jgi:hypothetical protein
MRTKLLLTVLFFAAINLVGFSQVFNKQGAGVTIIVHGWNPDGSQPAWMQNMADAIIARSGGAGKIGTITVSGSLGSLTATCSNWNFDLASQTSGEIVVLVNWTAVSNHLTMKVPAQDVAAVIAPKIYQSQSSQPALSELPVHLIGHSRGGGMVFEIARLLGLQGVEVEQVTALDSHPLTAADPQPITGNIIDTPIKLYENILFVDNYYQNIATPKGQYLTGAYNRLWTSLPGGYHNETGYTYNILGTNYNFSDHLNIILAYHGTINLATPVTNGQATMTSTERAWFNTFENAGENTGFKYSRIIIGNRKSATVPVASGDGIIAGYHNNALLGGSGTRDVLVWTSAVWPNLITASVFRSTTELQTGAQTLTANEILPIKYKYRSYANAGPVTFYVDIDRNPYNNNNQSTIGTQNLTATGSAITEPASTINWTVSGLSAGTKYYVYSKISDGTRTRFQYLDYEFSLPCIVNIPDANFKTLLLANTSINTNSDGEIQCSEAAAFTGEINVSGQSIADLTGIEAFTALSELQCAGNSLSSLDLSANTALVKIFCRGNLLTSLNVSGLTLLTDEFDCSYNQLSTLDVSTNTALLTLTCNDNLLTNLKITGATALSWITCDNNQLATLDVSANTNLTGIRCSQNLLTTLNVSSNTSLTSLYCDNNKLTSLNVSGLTSLTGFDCSYNQITSLNFTGLTSLSEIYCNDNLLTSLTVSGLTSLTSIDCENNLIPSLDVSGLTLLRALICYNNKLASLDVSTNTALQYLNCNDNLLTGLNVSGLTSLSEIECNNNQLTSLNISTNTALYSVKCEHNLLTSLVTGSTSLFQLWCGYNSLTGLNVSLNTSLANLYCYNNSITSLDISSNTSLSYFECNNNSLTSLNVKNGNNTNFGSFKAQNNPDLTCIQVDDAAWSTANWTNKDAGASFNTNCSSYTIAASVLPASSGSITGTGNYIHGATVSLTATANSSYSFANWTESGSQVSTNATYSFTAAANRTLVANFQLITGFENLLEDISATVYPNPNNGKFTINFNNNFIGEITININSAAGVKLKTIKLNKSTSEMSYNVDMGNMPKGIYFIDLHTIAYKVVKKVIFK